MLQFILLLFISIVVTGVITLFIIRGDVTNQLNNNVLSDLYDTTNTSDKSPNNQPPNNSSPNIQKPNDPSPNDSSLNDPSPNIQKPNDPSPNDSLPNDPSPNDPSPNDPSPNIQKPNDPSPNDSSPNNPTPDDKSDKPINCIGEWVDIDDIEQFVNGNIIRNGIERMRFKRENKLKENLENICNITTHCSNDENSRGVFKKKKQIFKITQNAKHGGKTCDIPNNEEREVPCEEEKIMCDIDCDGKWSKLTECNYDDCLTNDNVYYQTIYNINRPKQGNGQECKYNNGKTANELCKCEPINCEGSWVNKGTIEKFRNKEKLLPHNICNIVDHCKNTNESRGVYKKKRQRYEITQIARHGGKTCDVSNNEIKEMDCIDENVLCDIDCLGEWTPWSECDLSLCGGDNRVEQTRRYIVKQKKQGNGKECDYYDGQTEAKTCICNALDCDGYFEDITNCEINDFCDPFKTNQYKYKKQKFIKTQDARYGGKDCNYWDNEIILKICNGENGTNKVECDTDCVTQKEIKSECSIEKCEIDPEQVIIKMGTQILKNAVGNNKTCEIANIETINCSDQCKPIDCKFTMGEYGACDTADCDKTNNYSVKFELKLKDSWFNKDILLINECKNNIKKVLSEYMNISNDKLTIIDIIKNENNTTIIIKINNISKYKSELINNKLYDINILINVSENLNKKLKCQRQKICNKKNNNYVCETNGDIIKDCYVMENNNGGKFCDINDILTNDMEIGIIDVQKNQNVVRKRNIEKTSDAKYGGKCIEPTGDLTTSCENECPINCVGIWEEYGGCNSNKCPNGEEARGKYLKKKMRYRVITPSISGGDQCVDNIYNMGVVKNGQEIEIDCDELCPIDCIEEKQYSRCDIFDECGPMKEDGSYDIEHALEKQVKRRVMWIEKQKSQGRGRKCQNTPQINEQWESCNPIVKCPINCVYK
jgi:hypothetical protein